MVVKVSDVTKKAVVKKKAKKEVFKVDIAKWQGQENLIVVDVSAVMRSNFISLEQPFDGNYGKFRREPMSYEVNGVEMNTSSLYGLLRLFSKYKKIEADYIFCFDTPNNLLKKIDANYKANRVQMGDEYFDQVNTAYKLLKEAGYKVLAADGLEADHMVHAAVEQNASLYDNVAVVTNDKDLSCLVQDNVVWLNVLNKSGDITLENYEKELGCPYNSILLKKCMVGDKSDNIIGIFRFGQAAFDKFFREEGLVAGEVRGNEKEIIANAETLSDDKKGQALHALELILPLEVTADARANDEINRQLMVAFMDKYGMKSLRKIFE